MQRSWLAMRVFALAIGVGLWGCRDLELEDPFPCSTAGNCPAPYTCGSDNMCRRSPVDGGVGAGGRGGSAGGAGGRGGAGVSGSGGSTGGRGGAGGIAGSVATGGSGGTGGVSGSGGTAGSAGGSAGTGGSAATGGSAGTGGIAGTGGSAGTGGGAATGGSGGRGGAGGATAGTGGTATAGTGGAGAVAGTGGTAGTQGGRGGGGSGGSGGRGGSGGSGGTGGTTLANGQPCSGGAQCQSTYCVDGVCCENQCAGTCTACAMTKTGQTNGLCRAIPDGQNPDGECSAASCSAAMITPAGTCNGVNACRPGTAQNCPGGFGCASASACRTSCAVHADCASGYYCTGAVCVAKKLTGSPCAGASECASNYCVDSVCCGTACPLAAAGAGSCMGCSFATTGSANGTCAPRQGSTTQACPTTNPTACVNLQSDANNCNSCGNVCQSGGAPAGTARACLYGQCGFACTTSGTALFTAQSSARSCVRTTWNFENPDGSLPGVDGWTNSNETRIELVNTRHSGNQGIAFYASFLEMYPAYTDHYFRDSAGNIGTVDMRGKTFSAWVMVAMPTPISTDFCRLQAQTNLAPYDIFFGASATRMQPPGGTWFELTGTFGTTSAEAQVSGIWVMCKLPISWTDDDTRRWYVDDISVY